VAVHYPLDVVGGAVLGALVALAVLAVFRHPPRFAR
jgi:membrane-associated phospholipid phosphatase